MTNLSKKSMEFLHISYYKNPLHKNHFTLEMNKEYVRIV